MEIDSRPFSAQVQANNSIAETSRSAAVCIGAQDIPLLTINRDPQRYSFIGIEFDLINYHKAFERILNMRQTGRHGMITITNPHSILLCERDRGMRAATHQAALTLPDGIGIILAAKILGYPHQGRVTGPMLMLHLSDWGRTHGLRHFFYGGREGVADRLAERMMELFPGIQIAGTLCPPFRELCPEEDRFHVDLINATKPDIVWVGLGAPKQEKWMLAHHGEITAAAMIGVGAAFDFHSGQVPWAPYWVRKSGLEWAWRLFCEPRRMWRRNLDSPMFLMKVIGERLAKYFR